MFYRLSDDVVFRAYDDFGLLTDLADYRYRLLNDSRRAWGEKYVSKSGAVILAQLTRTPQDEEDIVAKLLQIFTGVSHSSLLSDVNAFLDNFVAMGYVVSGTDAATCARQEACGSSDISDSSQQVAGANTEEANIGADYFLRSLYIEVAAACNERCAHCYIPYEVKNRFMAPELFYRIIAEGRKLNIVHVTLSGGEPLMHKDIIGFMSACRQNDLAVNVLSNLTLLTDEMIDEMRRNHLLSVQASLYAVDDVVHDAITNLKGSCELTKKNILKLRAAGIPVQVSCPVIKQNKAYFPGVLDWAQAHNMRVVTEPEIYASYDHKGINLANRISVDEFSAVLDQQFAASYAANLYEDALVKEKYSADDPICTVCRYHFCIAADGRAFPCAGWQTNIIGDLRTQTVKDVWQNSPVIKNLRQIKRRDFPQCLDCQNRGYCTICMMRNANESTENDMFCINPLHCQFAALLKQKVQAFMAKSPSTV